jgi:hypothetical protein
MDRATTAIGWNVWLTYTKQAQGIFLARTPVERGHELCLKESVPMKPLKNTLYYDK